MSRIEADRRRTARIGVITVVVLLGLHGEVALATEGSAAPRTDPAAIAAVQAVVEKMGGREAWNATRYLRWHFRGRRLHHWDRFTGDVRIESGDMLVLMNLRTKEGRAFRDGVEITERGDRAEALEAGFAWWVNDSYWLIMPWKLLDPGVVLQDAGPSTLEDGREARKLVVTFEAGTGLTPRNRYDVWIAADTGLVEQWAYYVDASDPEPRFVLPWTGWRSFGEPPVLLATDHGDDADWGIELPRTLPRALFERPGTPRGP